MLEFNLGLPGPLLTLLGDSTLRISFPLSSDSSSSSDSSVSLSESSDSDSSSERFLLDPVNRERDQHVDRGPDD